MKVKNILFAVAALVGLTLFATSCKEDDGPENASSLVNTKWVAEVKDNKTDIDPVAWTLTFYDNKLFTLTAKDNRSGRSCNGTYIYKHSKVTLNFGNAWDQQLRIFSFDLTRTSEDTFTGYLFYNKKVKVNLKKKK